MIFDYSDPTHFGFEPPVSVKNYWYYTAKKERTIPGVSIRLPGLAGDDNFIVHLLGVIAILALEITAYVLTRENGTPKIIIISLMVVDFVLAWASHLPFKNLCLAENDELVADLVGNQALSDQIKQERITPRKRAIWFWRILIILSALAKIGSFFIGGDITSIDDLRDVFQDALIVILFYSIGAILHIICTGYCLFGLWYWFHISRAYRTYVGSGRRLNISAQHSSQEVQGYILYDTLPKVNHYEVIKRTISQDDNTRDSYFIKGEGVLTDPELFRLIQIEKNDDNKKKLIIEGIKLQQTIMQAQPANRN